MRSAGLCSDEGLVLTLPNSCRPTRTASHRVSLPPALSIVSPGTRPSLQLSTTKTTLSSVPTPWGSYRWPTKLHRSCWVGREACVGVSVLTFDHHARCMRNISFIISCERCKLSILDSPCTTGYKKGELEGKNVSILMPPPYNTRHNGYLKAYQATGIAVGCICLYITMPAVAGVCSHKACSCRNTSVQLRNPLHTLLIQCCPFYLRHTSRQGAHSGPDGGGSRVAQGGLHLPNQPHRHQGIRKRR